MKKLLIAGVALFLFSGKAMALANTEPIYTSTPTVGQCTLTGNIGLTRSDGVGTVGTDHYLCYTGGANGSFVSKVRITPAASASTSMTASVIRFYISTIASGSTAATNTFLFQEVAVAALAAAHTSNSTNFYEVVFNVAIPPGYTILASIDDNLAANTRWQIQTFSGNY